MKTWAAANSNAISNAILQTAAYADVFDYPLTCEELQRYLIGIQISTKSVEEALRGVPFLSRTDIYYTLQGRESIIQTRRRREQVARWLWPRAIVYGRLIAALPFVRLVAVTGALTMNNVEDDADIDYLIVTERGRLWLCRALVLLIGRIATRLHKVTLCPNYLVAQHALKFPDQTLYAAHEIAQMVPLSGFEVYEQMRAQNGWVMRFLPNAYGTPSRPDIASRPAAQRQARRMLEAVLRLPVFTFFERWEMNRKISRLSRELGASPEAAFSADYCKGHAHLHQSRTQFALDERLNRLQQESLW